MESLGKREDRIIEITIKLDTLMNKAEKFKINTVSFGAITTEETKKIIFNYKIAVEVAEKLNEVFFK